MMVRFRSRVMSACVLATVPGCSVLGESADDVDAITMSRAEVVGIISGKLEAGEIDGRADAGADSATLWLCQRVLLCAQRSAVVV